MSEGPQGGDIGGDDGIKSTRAADVTGSVQGKKAE
jgi:hypothetical protein